MDTLSPIETRRRSRSKTPFLRSACDHESCNHAGEEGHIHDGRKSPAVKKHPQIAAIIEESVDVSLPIINQQEVLLVTNESTPTKKQVNTIIATSDYSSNSSEDLSLVDPSGSVDPRGSDVTSGSARTNIIVTSSVKPSSVPVAANKTTTTTATSKSSKTIIYTKTNTMMSGSNNNVTKVNSSNTYSGNINNQIFSPAVGRTAGYSKEINQNELNSAFESSAIKTSTPILGSVGINRKKLIRNQENENHEDMSAHIAYQEYRAAGDYWNKFPKTDYTYSKHSTHRRELAPGVVAMPNMSRRSLEQHNERLNHMIERNPDQEDFLRRRYESTRFTQVTQYNNEQNNLLYDSQDEVDLNLDGEIKLQQYRRSDINLQRSMPATQEMFIEKTWITSLASYIKSIFYYDRYKFSWDNLYQTRIEQNDGFFGRLKSGIKLITLSTLSYFYLLISSILYLDTCLLKSSYADNKLKKRLLLLLLVILPLLLLAAMGAMDESSRSKIMLVTKNVMPISLIGISNMFNNWKDKGFGLLFSQSSAEYVKPISSNINFESSITNNMQKSLPQAEYENIKNIADIVIQRIIDERLYSERIANDEKLNKLSKEMSLLIANTVRENVLALIPTAVDTQNDDKMINYQLSDSDLELIVRKVQLKLSAVELERPITFTQENIAEITKLIKNNIEINNNQFNILEQINFDDLLLSIIGSSELLRFIDDRINKYHKNSKIGGYSMSLKDKELMTQQELIILKLTDEMATLKTNLAEILNENHNLQNSIDEFKIGQTDVMERLNNHELYTNSRFANLLAVIDEKMSNLNEKQFALINKQIKLSLIEILGYGQNGAIENKSIDEIDLQNWIRNMFVAKEFLEDKLKQLSLQTDERLKDEIDRSGMIIMKDVGAALKVEILKAIELKQQELQSVGVNINTELAEEEIKKIVRGVLAVYDADKTGLVDYALESAGGEILSTRCTENYQTKSAQISVLGIPLWYPSNTPRIAISPAVQPGECWAFQGFPGFLVLKLNTIVFVSGFTLEHIPKSLSPNGRIDSAPKNFTVWGLVRENDETPTLLGEYEYSDSSSSLQYFPVQNRNIDRPFDIVELRIESNHGNLQYTCLYRFRVHGKPSST